jgi:hypothetical protein
MDRIDAANRFPQYGRFAPSTFSRDKEVVLVPWNSEEGLTRLSRTQYKKSFYQLVHNFQPQINPLYCGIATAVIVLNSMRLPKGTVPSQHELEVQKPKAWGGDRILFPCYSQLTLLNEQTDQIKSRTIINLANIAESSTNDGDQFDPGLSLDDLRRILEVYDVKVDLFYADQDVADGVARFRTIVEAALNSSSKFIVVNFLGKTIGTTTGGHISPLGAYDPESDSVLVIDVAGHKNPWYWVPVTHLYQSMHVMADGSCRGWLIVSDDLPKDTPDETNDLPGGTSQ